MILIVHRHIIPGQIGLYIKVQLLLDICPSVIGLKFTFPVNSLIVDPRSKPQPQSPGNAYAGTPYLINTNEVFQRNIKKRGNYCSHAGKYS